MRACGEFRCPLWSPYERTPQRNNPSQIPYRPAVVCRIRKTGKIVTSFLTGTVSHVQVGRKLRSGGRGFISDIARICFPLNDFQRVQRANTGAGTAVASPVPGISCFKIGRPEGPGAALHGANCVDTAPPGFWVEEDAVSIRIIPQAPPTSHQFGVQQPDFTDWFSQLHSDGSEFLLRDPHGPRSSGAAIAALRTLKPQPLGVPWGSCGWIAAGILGTLCFPGVRGMTGSPGRIVMAVLGGSVRHYCRLRAIDRSVFPNDAISHHSVT